MRGCGVEGDYPHNQSKLKSSPKHLQFLPYRVDVYKYDLGSLFLFFVFLLMVPEIDRAGVAGQNCSKPLRRMVWQAWTVHTRHEAALGRELSELLSSGQPTVNVVTSLTALQNHSSEPPGRSSDGPIKPRATRRLHNALVEVRSLNPRS
jgi:hypothetical protein